MASEIELVATIAEDAAACATAELDDVLVEALGAAVKDGPGGVSVDCEAVDKTETDGLGTGTVGEVVESKAGQANGAPSEIIC